MKISKVRLWQAIALVAVFLATVSPLFGAGSLVHHYWQWDSVGRTDIEDFTGTFSGGGSATVVIKTGFDIDDFDWFYNYTDGYDYTLDIEFTGRSGQTLTIEGDASKNYHVWFYDKPGT